MNSYDANFVNVPFVFLTGNAIDNSLQQRIVNPTLKHRPDQPSREPFVMAQAFGKGGRSILAVAVTWMISVVSVAADEVETAASFQEAWQNAATFLVNDANKIFVIAKAAGDSERERRLGEAVTLFNRQPRTEGNLKNARRLLEQIISGNEDDDAGIFATYFLARWHESYSNPPQPDFARKLYRKLLERHAGNPLAEASASGLVLIDLYEDISSEERGRRFAELEKLAPLLKTSSGRRDYHLNIGNAYIDFSILPAKAIEHLVAADSEGISRWQIESATWISIGELARIHGDTILASRYYTKFLEKFKRDNRHYSIKKRLEALSQISSTIP